MCPPSLQIAINSALLLNLLVNYPFILPLQLPITHGFDVLVTGGMAGGTALDEPRNVKECSECIDGQAGKGPNAEGTSQRLTEKVDPIPQRHQLIASVRVSRLSFHFCGRVFGGGERNVQVGHFRGIPTTGSRIG